MKKLKEKEIDGVLRERMRAGLPTLCVCIGIQTMASSSCETPGLFFFLPFFFFFSSNDKKLFWEFFLYSS